MATATLAPERDLSVHDRQALRQRLDEFYQQVTDYTAFQSVSQKGLYWAPVGQAISAAATDTKPVEVLEIGAGRSGFAAFLESSELRHLVRYTAQDITDQNANWLGEQADELIVGDISTIPYEERFDIIFSTFVLEHITDPQAHLDTVGRLLKKGGKLFIFSPRYDLPGYLCPSSRHLSFLERLGFGWRCCLARLQAFTRQQPAFLIQTDLSAFHRPFFTDADAVHWVSMLDIRLWAQHHNMHFQPVKLISLQNTSLKNWLVKRWLTTSVQIQKRGEQAFLPAVP